MPLFFIDEDEETYQDFQLIDAISNDDSDSESIGDKAPSILYPRSLSLSNYIAADLQENQITELGTPQYFEELEDDSEVEVCYESTLRIINEAAPSTISSNSPSDNISESSWIVNPVTFK